MVRNRETKKAGRQYRGKKKKKKEKKKEAAVRAPAGLWVVVWAVPLPVAGVANVDVDRAADVGLVVEDVVHPLVGVPEATRIGH